jgi:hypothetical protein
MKLWGLGWSLVGLAVSLGSGACSSETDGDDSTQCYWDSLAVSPPRACRSCADTNCAVHERYACTGDDQLDPRTGSPWASQEAHDCILIHCMNECFDAHAGVLHCIDSTGCSKLIYDGDIGRQLGVLDCEQQRGVLADVCPAEDLVGCCAERNEVYSTCYYSEPEQLNEQSCANVDGVWTTTPL